MKTSSIIYFFNGLVSQLPGAYVERLSGNKGAGRLTVQGKQMQGSFLSPYKDANCIGNEHSHTWQQIDEKIYIGIAPNFSPEEVKRPATFSGFSHSIDGKEWGIPVLNPFTDTCDLPRCETISWTKEKGKQISSEVVPEYAELVEEVTDLVLDIQDKFMAGGIETLKLSIDDDKLRSLIARSIGINYDISFDELFALKVLRTDNYVPILQSIIDWEGIITALIQSANDGFFLNKANETEDTPSGEKGK